MLFKRRGVLATRTMNPFSFEASVENVCETQKQPAKILLRWLKVIILIKQQMTIKPTNQPNNQHHYTVCLFNQLSGNKEKENGERGEPIVS